MPVYGLEWQEELVGLTGICRQVYTQPLSCPDLFHLAKARSHEPGCVFLASGGEVDSARYHLLAVRPWFVLVSKGEDWVCQRDEEQVSGSGSPLSVLRFLLQTNHLPRTVLRSPVGAGLFGYLGYELNRLMEDIPRTSLDDTGLPDMYLTAPSIVLVQDRQIGHTWLQVPQWDHARAMTGEEGWSLCRQWLQEAHLWDADQGQPQAGAAESSLNHAQYLRAVRAIQEYIRSGHVYQVNLSQRLVHPFQGDPFSLFSTLFARNPAPFYAYIQAGDHQVISTSPERFLAVDGDQVETRPIKGTRPRGKTPEQDAALARELQQSSKDGAELSMIVDLMRNDLGRVCTPGSVRVTEHKRLEAYDNVYHLVSVINGVLQPKHDLVDLIQAAFPGGSITGCPKVRAMQIIDELEPVQRHVYTGSIGYLGFDRQMDLSIAIRTAVASQNRLVYSVGGGVVIDSEAEDEYAETWHKGWTFTQVLRESPQSNEPPAWVWYNGHLVADSEAACLVRSPAVEYGFGVFETLRADGERLWFVPEHMARMASAWRSLTGRFFPDLDWEAIITQVVAANQLQGPAAIKIYAGLDRSREVLSVSARKYTHRLAGTSRKHLELVTHPEPRQSFLAGMKTANHLIYILAGAWAREQGADEALILNPDGTVSETNSANIVLLSGSQAIVPSSRHVLPGVMQAKALKALVDLGWERVESQVDRQDLLQVEAVLVTNSLFGVLGAGRLDGTGLNVRDEVVDRVNELVFGKEIL